MTAEHELADMEQEIIYVPDRRGGDRMESVTQEEEEKEKWKWRVGAAI